MRLYSRCCALLRQARRSGKPLPPLFCVPVLVKDNFDTVGMVATAGSIALMDNFPQRDAQPVRPRPPCPARAALPALPCSR